MQSVAVVAIDPQNDFCKPDGALFVPGADKDMSRAAEMIRRLTKDNKLDEIQITLDSHYQMHIAHPIAWVDENGNHPDPFSVISLEDAENGVWRPFHPGLRDRFIQYLKDLNRVHMIWPPHCIIGSPGACIYPDFYEAVTEWELKNQSIAPRTTKGSNPFTEHFSAVKAEVPDPTDPGTNLNEPFINTLRKYDIIGLLGEALDYCLSSTFRHVAEKFSDEEVAKMTLILDATSNVDPSGVAGDLFIKELTARGMKTSTTSEFLS